MLEKNTREKATGRRNAGVGAAILNRMVAVLTEQET